MTDRERWTVYPLLFLTLGIAVKDKIAGRSTADTVLCSTLVVHDRKGKEQVVISSTPDGGRVAILGPKNGWDVLVGYVDKLAGLMFVDGRGRLIRSLATMPTNVVTSTEAHRPGPEPQDPSRQRPPDGQPPEETDKPASERPSPE